jgi:hypothetical protein
VGKPSASAAAPVAGQVGAYVGVGVAGGSGAGGGGGGGGDGSGSGPGPDMTKDWNIYTITANIYSMFFLIIFLIYSEELLVLKPVYKNYFEAIINGTNYCQIKANETISRKQSTNSTNHNTNSTNHNRTIIKYMFAIIQ